MRELTEREREILERLQTADLLEVWSLSNYHQPHESYVRAGVSGDDLLVIQRLAHEMQSKNFCAELVGSVVVPHWSSYNGGTHLVGVRLWPLMPSPVHAMNRAASALGKLAKGKKKNLSKEEIARRTKRLKKARSKRWPPLYCVEVSVEGEWLVHTRETTRRAAEQEKQWIIDRDPKQKVRIGKGLLSSKMERAKYRTFKKAGLNPVMVAGSCEVPYGTAKGRASKKAVARLLAL